MNKKLKKHWLHKLGITGYTFSILVIGFMYGAYDRIIKGEGIYYFYLYLIHVFILLIISIIIMKLKPKNDKR